jgi:hypothetical protein
MADLMEVTEWPVIKIINPKDTYGVSTFQGDASKVKLKEIETFIDQFTNGLT